MSKPEENKAHNPCKTVCNIPLKVVQGVQIPVIHIHLDKNTVKAFPLLKRPKKKKMKNKTMKHSSMVGPGDTS